MNKEIMNDVFVKTSPSKFVLSRLYEYIFSKEAFYSIIFSGLTIYLFLNFYENDISTYKDKISALVLTIIGGLISMIAFSLSALALILTVFKNEDIEKISMNKEKIILKSKVEIFAKLIYRFYIAGILNLISIFLLTLSYIVINFPLVWPTWIIYLISFFTIYNTFFSLFFTILLIPTCIKFKFIEYI